jgi:hypothetical protein
MLDTKSFVEGMARRLPWVKKQAMLEITTQFRRV